MEKFALLNILKTLEGLSAKSGGGDAPEPAAPPPPPPAPDLQEFNAMANVLERHEQISNRVRNKR